MGVRNCSMFCCTLLCVRSSIAIILMGKRELIALLNLSSWCLVMVERLFLAVPRGCLQFVIVVFPDHTHLLFWVRRKECEPWTDVAFKSPAWFCPYCSMLFCDTQKYTNGDDATTVVVVFVDSLTWGVLT